MNGDSIALDTNIAVHILNDQADAVVWLKQFRRVFLPVPVIGELNFGARNSRRVDENLSRMRPFLARAAPLDADSTTADVYGRLRMELKRQGRPIPENDLWIAALCVQHDVPLATVDRHFSAIGSLIIVAPSAT